MQGIIYVLYVLCSRQSLHGEASRRTFCAKSTPLVHQAHTAAVLSNRLRFSSSLIFSASLCASPAPLFGTLTTFLISPLLWPSLKNSRSDTISPNFASFKSKK